MNQDNGYTTNCPRCGAEMNSNARYCMKCGNLNYNHEANKSMQSFVKKNDASTYVVGSGNSVNNNSSNDKLKTLVATNTGNKNLCFGVNIFIYFVALLLNVYISLKESQYSIFENTNFLISTIFLSLTFMYLYSYQLIAMKCNKPWWSVFIPFYNLMIFSEIVFNNKWIGLLVLVPGVGQILFLVMIYILGKKFGYNGVLTVLFFAIFILMIAYGSHIYNGCIFLDKDSDNSLEREYKLKKAFLTICMLILIVFSILYLIININTIISIKEKINNYYFVFASKRVASKVKDKDKSKLTCSLYDYSDKEGIYYIYFPDVGSFVYLPFYYQRDYISGYIKIDNSTGVSKYSISLSDGTYGFGETLVDDMDVDTVIKYKKIDTLNRRVINVCRYL